MNVAQELDELLGLGKRQRPLPKTLQASGYTHVRELGAGGFGAALLIYNTKTKEHVVAKHVNLSQMSLKSRKLAHNEIHILQQMKHPNIVRYIEYTEEHPHLYILMEYCDGGDLYSLIKKMKARRTPMNEDQVVALFLQVAMAIKYMHDQKVLHRDIKSQNVFLTKAHVVKLGDFGISTVLQNTVAMAKTMCGTPCYFSPELCRGEEYNNKSDIWALGILLYEMCTFKLPFDINNMKRLLESIVRDPCPQIPTNYSPALRDLCAQMLEKDHTKRPDINGVLRHSVMKDRMAGLAAQLSESCPKKDLLSPRSNAAPVAAASSASTAAGAGPGAAHVLHQRQPQPYGRVGAGQREDLRGGAGFRQQNQPAQQPADRSEQPPQPPPRQPEVAKNPYRYQEPAPAPSKPVPEADPIRRDAPVRAPGGAGGLGLKIPNRLAEEAAKEREQRGRSNSPQVAPLDNPPQLPRANPPVASPDVPHRQPTPPAEPVVVGRPNSAQQQQQPPRVIPTTDHNEMLSQKRAGSSPPPPVAQQQRVSASSSPPPKPQQFMHEHGAEALLLAEPSPEPKKAGVSSDHVEQQIVFVDEAALDRQRQQIAEEEDEYESLVSMIKNLETLDRVLTSPGTSPGRTAGGRTSTRLGSRVVASSSKVAAGELQPQTPPPVGSQQHHEPEVLVIDHPAEEEGGEECLDDEEIVESFADPFGTKLEGIDDIPEDLMIQTEYGAGGGGGVNDGSVIHDSSVIDAVTGGTVVDVSNQRLLNRTLNKSSGGEVAEVGSTSASAAVDSSHEIEDNTTFDILCLCGRVRLVGDFTAIYGSFTCKSEVCRKVSGASAVELLHLPDMSGFQELSVEPLVQGNMRDPNESLRMPKSYRHPADGSTVFFCDTCGSLLGLNHAGLSGCVVVKNALSERSMKLLMANQHEEPPLD